ncbi:hypothetical protein I6N90_19480 [Paenibacillus sp. GSMTC-2017]|uniref:hypothetical protein n=1 Tax=Paenibacillus sp. GSMTC-2017 TaxID=2794350 RepID=UPI0018D8C996|nr:hypothetical protein [Paenibacillus sp. GSMTC-2017]MBH5319986.1 hypothetical protein [Paenibacillus sp. GSMTC-2017]
MPDWSYQTLFRPILFRLPSRISRSITLQAMGRISKIPGGSFVIRTLGHMEQSPLLERKLGGLSLTSPIGLSGGVDLEGTAHRALAQFGFGFIEIGPVTTEAIRNHDPIDNNVKDERINYPSYFENEGLTAVAERLKRPRHKLPQLVRLAPLPGATPHEAIEQLESMIQKLSASGAAGFYLDVASGSRSWEDIELIYAEIPQMIKQAIDLPFFLYVPLELSEDRLAELLKRPETTLLKGAVIGEAAFTCPSRVGSVVGEGASPSQDQSFEEAQTFPVFVGKEGLELALRKTAFVKGMCGASFIVKAGAGVHEPYDALLLQEAGADLVILHSGLVYSGPGLPKRINEAIIYETVRHEEAPSLPSFWSNWGWMCLLGIGMIIGGLLAWWIGETTVLLPYDLSFLGMTIDEIHNVNHHLIHFMSHDRITLAGTMISIGILYYQLARYGQRLGQHWAKTALMTSGIVGFSGFFLYLGYGYFDPLHAMVSAILLPMFILSLRRNDDRPNRKPVNLHNDKAWRLAMWGQLCFVVLGFALTIGGIVIAGVGITNVFVKADLAFLNTTRDILNAVNPKLMSLIAHDRAGFGGALLCNALAILIIALWGIGQGERWLWWTLLVGGAPGFYAGFSVHYGIGYTDFIHLSPAIFALFLYFAGLILLYPYMMSKPKTAKTMR